ncbi:MAG: hypothetical protein V1754_08230 [Pseudomonadota bacterium]
MGIRYRIGAKLAKTPFVANALEERADLDSFRKKPSARLVIGLLLIVLSFVVGGLPTLALIGVLAIYWGNPLFFAIGAPVVYGLSWLIWAAGMFLAGHDSLLYANIFFRWLVRKITEKFLCQRSDPTPDSTDSNSSSKE